MTNASGNQTLHYQEDLYKRADCERRIEDITELCSRTTEARIGAALQRFVRLNAMTERRASEDLLRLQCLFLVLQVLQLHRHGIVSGVECS